jgi:hypothetical protein
MILHRYPGCSVGRYVIVSIAALILLSCQPETPIPTPTPTRTPVIPTATPTDTPTPTLSPTPTSTPTPTPTLPPGLVLPPTPVIPEDWPPLPSNLYFLRGGDLNIWLAEGEHVASIPLPDEAAENGVLKYQVSANGEVIWYVSDGGTLYQFDRAEWSNTRLSTTGRLIYQDKAYFNVTPEETWLIYLAWGVQPTAEHRETSVDSAGTLLMMDLNDPRRQQVELGFCQGDEDTPCEGFVVAPDGRSLVMSDVRGLHLIRLDGGIPTRPELMLPSTLEGVAKIKRWSPDGRWFVVEHHTSSTTELIVIDIESPELASILIPFCEFSCSVEIDWLGTELWAAIRHSSGDGCLFRHAMEAPVPSSPAEVTCAAPGLALNPVDVFTLPDGAITFLHHGSAPLSSGVYVYRPNTGNLTPIALVSDDLEYMIWSEDGSAFVVSDALDVPQVLGWVDRGVLLDVSARLDGAMMLRWEHRERPTQ